MAKKQVSIIERRLQGPSALRESSQPIPLTDDSYLVRWTNSEIMPDHTYRRIHQQGWEYCVPGDLAVNIEEIGALERDGRIVRGERGKEVLVKMKKVDYAKIQKKKTAENVSQTFDRKKLKNAVVNQLGQEHGDQAASFMHKTGMTVTDSRERVNIDE